MELSLSCRSNFTVDWEAVYDEVLQHLKGFVCRLLRRDLFGSKSCRAGFRLTRVMAGAGTQSMIGGTSPLFSAVGRNSCRLYDT